MKSCMCSLAGTRHCDNCSNGPSRTVSFIPEPPRMPTTIEEKLDTIIRIHEEQDEEEMKKALKEILSMAKKEAEKPYYKTWTSTSL